MEFSALPPGSIVDLGAEDFGDAVLGRLQDVTLRGGRFRSLNISQCEGLTLEGAVVDWTPTEGEGIKANALRVAASKGIALKGLTITGQPVPEGFAGAQQATDTPWPGQDALLVGYYAGRAVAIEFCEDVALTGCDISGFHSAVAIGKSERVLIEANEIHHNRTTGVKGGGEDLVIRANHIHHATPWRFPDDSGGDHLDGIHLFTGKGAPVSGLIEGNLIDAGDGFPLIPVLIGDNGRAGVDVTIRGNVLISGNTQGISLGGQGIAASVVENVLLGPPGSAKVPTIITRTSDIRELAGNLCHNTSVKPYLSQIWPDNEVLPRKAASADQVQAAREAWAAKWRPSGPAHDPRDARVAELEALISTIRQIAIESRTTRTVGPWDRVRALTEGALNI